MWPIDHHSNNAALMALHLESAQSRLLVKMAFLKISDVVARHWWNDLESWCLVKECKKLAIYLGTDFGDILVKPEVVDMKEVLSKS